MAAQRQFRLSASSLAVLLECPRCFWLQVNENIRRPQGPFPSLPSGMDEVLKRYMDTFRKRGVLPPELKGHVNGTLYPNQAQLDRWRDALRGDLRTRDPARGLEVSGAIDDLLLDDRRLTPLDFKTRGWAVKDDTHKHYEHQLDLYAWLLEKLGHQTTGKGILLFFSPTMYEGLGLVRFRVEPVELVTDVRRAEGLLERGLKILRGPRPKQHADCAFCLYAQRSMAEAD